MIFSGISVLILILVHVFVNKLNLSYIPRSKWLSAAGGISVAYIFIHVLPELKEWQDHIEKSSAFSSMSFMQDHLYYFSLLGLTTFYGLERVAKKSKQSTRTPDDGEKSENTNVFWVHMLSFGIYNFLIGYLLVHREQKDLKSILFFTVAMAFHFMVNDYALLDHYREKYKHQGRWMVVGFIIIGWLIGVLLEIPETYIGIVFAFIAGGVILNVLKEELPEERESYFSAFLLGVIFYSALLLTI